MYRYINFDFSFPSIGFGNEKLTINTLQQVYRLVRVSVLKFNGFSYSYCLLIVRNCPLETSTYLVVNMSDIFLKF